MDNKTQQINLLTGNLQAQSQIIDENKKMVAEYKRLYKKRKKPKKNWIRYWNLRYCFRCYCSSLIFINMALTPADKKDIEVMIRKEIKDFLDSNTLKQFEATMIEKIRQEIQKGKIKGDINEIVAKIMKEFYRLMWTQRSFWEPALKNVK